jgi:hypothetical protein
MGGGHKLVREFTPPPAKPTDGLVIEGTPNGKITMPIQNDGSKPGVFQELFERQSDKPKPSGSAEPVETSDPVKLEGPASVHQFPSTMEIFLDRTVDINTLPLPLTRLPGKLRTRPDQELIYEGFAAFVAEIAPPMAPVIADKNYVPYYMAMLLKAAEFIGKTREKALAEGRSTFGKQRSSSHVEFIGPGILIDGDDDPFALIPKLKLLAQRSRSTAHTRTSSRKETRGRNLADGWQWRETAG